MASSVKVKIANLQKIYFWGNLNFISDVFAELATLGRFSHKVMMSVCLCVCLFVCLRHRMQCFSRPLIGPEIT